MKKIVFFLVAVLAFCFMLSTAYAVEFSDFNQRHWAYEYVNELVNSKTINGFEDGTFRPESRVTRAEFVKMIGMGPERRASDFDDVPMSHWAYEYVMTSGLEALAGNVFKPDVFITRGEVAELLWKRGGSFKGISVPPIVHRQAENYDAVSWVYSKGIMRGDNNLNLRLGDTLTRAEATALIVRSRNVSNASGSAEFMSLIDERLFEIAYNSFNVSDKPYLENANLTNGELAMAAARIICDEHTPTYENISATVSFEHKYAQSLNMLCRYYLGEENDNIEYVEKNATVKDAVAALMFAITKSANSIISAGDKNANYPLAKNETNQKLKNLLSIAYNNGICFDTPDNMPMDKEITLKEFACLLIEFDGFSGFYTADRLGVSSYYVDMKMSSDLDAYPSNSEDYRIILESVPAYVYEAPFASGVSLPKDTYFFTNDYKSIFESMLVNWMSRAHGNGVTLGITYYPGLAVDNGNGYTMRVMVAVEDADAGKKLSDIIKLNPARVEDFLLTTGDSFYADIETGVKVNDVRLPVDNMEISLVLR